MASSLTLLVSFLTITSVAATPITGRSPQPRASLEETKRYWENKGKEHHDDNKKVFYFDKVFVVKATPDQVRNGTTPAPGEPGAKGLYKLGINKEYNTVCYNIVLSGVTGEYSSPAVTATHLHEAARGASGPPRLAFQNPQGPDDKRVSCGCLTGPFTTGIVNNGVDTGANFHVSQIIDNPAGFFVDTHTKKYTLGAVRGQLE
ncbi:hypothetical protein BU24DRAFT_431683 [Aaosphaeria arxii CBS 175.79]|uniref:CHRD domain-containing protein n=1 Tax=Aaosphaeria arxii CBS 175.79 TaxID=1450172 RepID=A0A6A5Y500_9PLEO|nr:uncharacterized protein BU24DRAFT_431683 [Aaosphaeria arxii CBS 175.79]KAF2020117.1 hypothetical protein BU24DRAFT_431683 [Aaosphaeria arxii CBS 175.79]